MKKSTWDIVSKIDMLVLKFLWNIKPITYLYFINMFLSMLLKITLSELTKLNRNQQDIFFIKWLGTCLVTLYHKIFFRGIILTGILY